MQKTEDSIGLVDGEKCLALLFPEKRCRPTLRTFLEWKARGKIPYRKIGKRIYYDPVEVRRSIDRNCKIEAGE
jgi:hypothetical protein